MRLERDEEEADRVCEIKRQTDQNESGVEIGAFTRLQKHIPSHGAARGRACELELAGNMAACNFTGNPRGDNIDTKVSVICDTDGCYRVFEFNCTLTYISLAYFSYDI